MTATATALLRMSPIDPPALLLPVEGALTIREILDLAEAPAHFAEFGIVKVGGEIIPSAWWESVRIRPDSGTQIELCVVPGTKSLLTTLATIATIVLVSAISGGLLAPLFGGAFAAGTLGASLAAAGVGLAGQMLIGSLSAPPASANTDNSSRRKSRAGLGQGGISVNSVEPFAPLPVILGKMGLSAPLLAPPYTEFVNGEIIANAVVGVQGRCAISNVLINGLDPSLFTNLDIETREGADGESQRSLARWTVLEDQPSLAMSKFDTIGNTDQNDWLADQATPANSVARWHYFSTDGVADEFRLRCVMSGLAVSDIPNALAAMAIRVEARRVGDTTWRKFPTAHVYDKTAGRQPSRFEMTFKWSAPKNGRHLVAAYPTFDMYYLRSVTAESASFRYDADDYFKGGPLSGGFIPTMTGSTGFGFTISASSATSGFPAWQACDQNETTYWQSAAFSLPTWLKVKTNGPMLARSYGLVFASGATAPNTAGTYFLLWGSNDDATWVELDRVDLRGAETSHYYGQIDTPQAYTYYRVEFFANNGQSQELVIVREFKLFSAPCFGSGRGDGDAIADTANCALSPDGVTYWLDPDYSYAPSLKWPRGEYEFRVMRSWVYRVGTLDSSTYAYDGSTSLAFFFTYAMSAGHAIVYESPKRLLGDMQIELAQTKRFEEPFDPTGIALIAIRIPNAILNSIYAEFTSYARVLSSNVWLDYETPTANPAALYRKMLLGGPNPNPVPGDLIDEDAISAWFARCFTNGYEVNAVVEGDPVDAILQMIASAGNASMQQGALYGVVEDYDTSGDPVEMLLSPNNSRDLGTSIILPQAPHAVRASFNDASDSFRLKQTIVYRNGFSAQNATLFEQLSYPGRTSEAQVIARASFDMAQIVARRMSLGREVGIAGYALRRGSIVGVADDVVDPVAFGIISAVTVSAGNITDITLDTIMPFSTLTSDIAADDDVTTLADVMNPAIPMAISIQIDDGTVVTLAVATVTDSNVATLSVPLAVAGSGIAAGQMVSAGAAAKTYRRCRVLAIEPTGLETRRLTLVPEAPELFA